jgi:acyl-CoA thioester hydrolase
MDTLYDILFKTVKLFPLQFVRNISINIERRGAKLVFLQDIHNSATGELSVKGEVDVVCLKDGRLTRGEVFDEMFKDYFNKN